MIFMYIFDKQSIIFHVIRIMYRSRATALSPGVAAAGVLRTRADSRHEALMALINSIGPAIDEKTAKAHLYNLHYQGLMDARSAKIMESALTGWNQHGVDEQVLDQIRARQFKQMLLAYIN